MMLETLPSRNHIHYSRRNRWYKRNILFIQRLCLQTKAGARLYKAIATANTGDDAAAVNAAFKSNANDDDIQTYKEGYCYYTAWIKHNPGGTTMQQDKYGVVRNFWYELTVNSIKKLGYSKPTYKDPKDPDDKAEASIQVQVKIKKWRLVKQM